MDTGHTDRSGKGMMRKDGGSVRWKIKVWGDSGQQDGAEGRVRFRYESPYSHTHGGMLDDLELLPEYGG